MTTEKEQEEEHSDLGKPRRGRPKKSEEEKRERDRLRKANQRANMTDKEKKRGRQQRANQRANTTPEQREKDRQRKANERANINPEQREVRQAIDRAKKRSKTQKTTVELKEAMRSADILDGIYHVPELKDTDDDIGPMTIVCPHCGALKFKGESPSSCCQNGKVLISPFPRPPDPLLNLWLGDSNVARLFRQNARYIYNAGFLCD